MSGDTDFKYIVQGRIICLFIDASATVRLDEQTQNYVAYCSLFNVYSQGATLEESINSLKDAVELYLEACDKNGVVLKNFKSL